MEVRHIKLKKRERRKVALIIVLFGSETYPIKGVFGILFLGNL